MKALEYAKSVVSNEIPAPKYVKIVCQKFIDIYENRNTKYCTCQEGMYHFWQTKMYHPKYQKFCKKQGERSHLLLKYGKYKIYHISTFSLLLLLKKFTMHTLPKRN